MINLFKSEWQRLYIKKTTWICFISIPIILIALVKHYLKVNSVLNASSPEFMESYKFPIVALQNYSMLLFDLLFIMLIVLCVTDEFRNGSIRMVLLRPIKKLHLFYAKFLVLLATLFLLLTTYFLLAYLIGFIAFPRTSNISLNYFKHSLPQNQVIIYAIKTYLIELFTLTSMCSLIFFISTISKTITIAFGANLGIIVVGLIFSPIMVIFTHKHNANLIKLQWLISIPKIQTDGIQLMLAQTSHLLLYGLGVLFIYAILFTALNYLIYSKSDILI
ncbi:ABC transporter permease [Clostridium hydrogenum]|uniref:ABC transporter permease n=1 Tax=Clostridium hydrogenum TaxID=2855764 RepID=UPI001F2132DA|nr:ABC transporter permease [Clostridium hydrogenum]